MLRTAERYFDVVLAAESLRVLQRQQVARAHAEAMDRFRLGDVPIHTHEAAARLEAIRAQVLAAETQLELARTAFADATGLADGRLDLRLPAAGPGGGAPLPALAQWLADAKTRNCSCASSSPPPNSRSRRRPSSTRSRRRRSMSSPRSGRTA